LCISRS